MTDEDIYKFNCHGIMIPESYDVVARKESLNHMLRLHFQGNARGIMIPESYDVAFYQGFSRKIK